MQKKKIKSRASAGAAAVGDDLVEDLEFSD
jgi:hypothetical protein